MADDKPAAPSLADLRYFNSRSFGGIGPEEINTPRARAFLDALHAYDPNAQFTPVQLGGEGGSGAVTYQLQFDPSLLPGAGVDMPGVPNTPQLGGPNPVTAGYGNYVGGSSFLPVNWEQVGNDTSRLKDPSLVFDSSPYGRITPEYNLGEEPLSTLDILGPLGVAGFGLLMGGMPALYQGIFGQGAYGGGGTPGLFGSGSDLSGLGASDPYLQGGTGAMDMTGSAGTGIPGSFGANAPLGSAESSLYGTGALDNPAGALGGSSGGSSTSWWDRVRQAVSKLPTSGLGGLGAGTPGLLGGGGGGAGGGGAAYPYEDALAILARFYGVPEETAKKIAQGARHG